MAKAKKTVAKKDKATKEKETKAVAAKGGKKQISPEERKAKAQARKERLAQLPEGQRPNSKTIDVIEMENGSKVMVYAQPIRKFGVIITSVVIDADGNAISSSTTTLAGYRVKAKKGHGNLVVGAPGTGKKGKGGNAEDADEVDGADDDDSDDEEED